MFNSEEEKFFDENDFSSLVASCLRNVIENSVTDLVLAYRTLSLARLSSWATFQKDLIQMLRRNSNTNQEYNQVFILFLFIFPIQSFAFNCRSFFFCMILISVPLILIRNSKMTLISKR